MLADEVVDCHVLVIGSGGAGVRAAIEASQYGDTVLISKTIVGKGGCTPMAEGGYNAVLREQDSCGIHYEDTMKGGAYLNDPELVNILVKEAPLRMGDLVKWGAVFDFTDTDEVAQRPFGGQRFPRTCYAGDRTGHEMMTTLVERLDGTKVTTLQEYTVTDLLKDGTAVIGAMALDERGSLVLLKADSTVLATGGGAKVYDISTNSSGGTGDGFAMGYRAGAELIDMEMVQFHPTGAVSPYDARGRLVEDSEKNIALQRAEIGMVFQRFNLFPHLTSIENIMEAPLNVRRTPREQAEADAERLLARVGLSDKRDKYPGQLSGGQQQRIAIARALAMKPSLMLFDEPTSALDPEMIGEVLDVMKELAKEITMIVVSHEMGFVRAAANRTLFVDEGRIIEDTTPEELFTNPREERTKAFLSKIL